MNSFSATSPVSTNCRPPPPTLLPLPQVPRERFLCSTARHVQVPSNICSISGTLEASAESALLPNLAPRITRAVVPSIRAPTMNGTCADVFPPPSPYTPNPYAPVCVTTPVPGNTNRITTLDEYGWEHTYPDSDPVHFDYVAAQDLSQQNLVAFQRLANRYTGAHLVEDGLYGPATEAALAAAPCDGYTE